MIGDNTKARQRLVLAYVWRRWSEGHPSHHAGMSYAAGYTAKGSCIVTVVARLVADGMLSDRRAKDHAGRVQVGFVPGPRFGGVDKAGRVYQVVA